MPSKPNIVLIMADQLGASAIGCYGSGVDSTPNLDRLAAQGMRFDRNYDSVPLCGPNRACILTGRSPVCNGVIRNNMMLQSDMPTYASVLRETGYRTGGFGKFHQTPMALPVPVDYSYLGFDEVAVTEDPRLGPWLDWVETEHPDHWPQALATAWEMAYCASYGPEGRDIRPLMRQAKDDVLTPLLRHEPWALCYRSPLPAELGQTAWITDRAIDFIERQAAGQGDQPFLCKVSYVDPHDPYDPPEPYDTLFDPADMPLARPRSWDPDANPVLARSCRFHGWERAVMDPRTVPRLRALYHGSLKYMDDQIGRLLTRLDELGLSDNTLVVFTTDHGEMLGDQELITKGVKHYDAGIRCPLIARGPGVLPGRVSDRLTCSLDFVPTFCDWAGIPETRRPPLEGLSFASACHGEDGPSHASVAVEMTRDGHDTLVRSVVTADRKRLTWFQSGSLWQLFDLAEDPDEQHDRSDDPACRELRMHLTERMLQVYAAPVATHQYRNEVMRDGKRLIPNSGFGFDVRD